ncbi:DUF2442 domain-containing protein [Peptacetobacter hiranonis]|uniref:DUF2442 domain-containing protein n=1 Tax=Peptacetobacter hiranonis TaxID=89152 RepID=UPI0022E205B1|nr:DUF2442 domain-containing protein [Peptacetobacter hiranonis]
MIIKIKDLKVLEKYKLLVTFNNEKKVVYDVENDINSIPSYSDLKNIPGLFENAHLDSSRTCIEWNEFIDLPSDIIYKYGIENELLNCKRSSF